MNRLYVECILALRPNRSAFQHADGDEHELNKLLVKELSTLLTYKQFNPNNDIDKVDLLQLAYGICIQVYDNPLRINPENKSIEWLTINDFLNTISIYATSKEQSSIAICMAMHILSMQRNITPEAYRYAELMMEYCSQTALDSRLYRHFCALRTDKSKKYNINWSSFKPTLHDLCNLPYSIWNTITHGFSMDVVERWLNYAETPSDKTKLLQVITSAFEEDVRQRKIAEEQNDNFDW